MMFSSIHFTFTLLYLFYGTQNKKNLKSKQKFVFAQQDIVSVHSSASVGNGNQL